MIDINTIDLGLAGVYNLEWLIRKEMQNTNIILGNCSHQETPYFSKEKEEYKYSYLSFQAKIDDDNKRSLRFGFIYVSELKRKVFINEFPFEVLNLIGYELYKNISEIDELVKRETGINLEEQNNEYYIRF
jgi:hypothetical protein